MSKFLVIYDQMYTEAADSEQVKAREFYSEHSLVTWLLRYSYTYQIIAISESADIDSEDEVE